MGTRVERATNRVGEQKPRTVDNASDHHHVEQGAHRLDAVLPGGPGAARGDVLGDLVVCLVKLALLIALEGRVRVSRARNAKVRLLEVLREQAGGLQVLPGALEPLVVELGGGRARPPGGDILLYDAPDFVGAAEASVRARDNSVIGRDKVVDDLLDTRAGR